MKTYESSIKIYKSRKEKNEKFMNFCIYSHIKNLIFMDPIIILGIKVPILGKFNSDEGLRINF